MVFGLYIWFLILYSFVYFLFVYVCVSVRARTRVRVCTQGIQLLQTWCVLCMHRSEGECPSVLAQLQVLQVASKHDFKLFEAVLVCL